MREKINILEVLVVLIILVSLAVISHPAKHIILLICFIVYIPCIFICFQYCIKKSKTKMSETIGE